MSLSQRIEQHFRDGIELKKRCATELVQPVEAAVGVLFAALSNGNKILACGNGGSASDAQHFVAELVGRLERNRIPLAALTLNVDASVLTALANDFGFDDIFATQVRALGQPGDVLVAISTSGNSPNVLRAVEAAHAREMRVVALTGKGGGKIAGALRDGDAHICVPHDRTMRIQEVHIVVVHSLCDGIDYHLLGDGQ